LHVSSSKPARIQQTLLQALEALCTAEPSYPFASEFGAGAGLETALVEDSSHLGVGVLFE